VSFTVRAVDVEELAHGEAAELVRANALRKALAARGSAGEADEAVLACDTLVSVDGAVYGKAADRAGARAALRALSGRTHSVHSAAVVLLGEGETRAAQARTDVSFRGLGETLLEWYLERGEWRERAGSYAIQGAGAALVREVRGDYENVVGLPLAALLDVYPELLEG
jgi:septum formation protein